MIKPITEEYFQETIGSCKKYNSRTIKLLKRLNSKDWYSLKESERFPIRWENFDGYLYFEKPGQGVFALIVDTPCTMIIPEIYSEITIDENEEIDFSDWKMTRLGDPDPIYTLNALGRCTDWSPGWTENLIKKIVPGKYLIENEAIGYSNIASIKISVNSWERRLYVGFPELLETPYNYDKVKRIGRMLRNYILWSLKD